ncbi:RUB1, partial [Symbiodinium sp. KB8]
MQPVRESEESEHISVQFSELVDPMADFSRCRYANEVLLEDEQMLPHRKGAGGGLRVSIEMTALYLAAPEVLNEPELLELLRKQPAELRAFRLTLSLGAGRVTLEQLVAESDASAIQLRFDTVEKQLPVDRSGEDESQVSHTLVMADDASELQEALSALQVCLQVPGAARQLESGDFELPVDLSTLISCLPEGGSDEVVAEVQTDPLPAGQGITLLATLTSFCWSSSHGEDLLPGRPRDADIWASGARLLAVGLRLWRLSIEIRSIRLTARDAKVYVTYSYPPLRQPRAFRTNPPAPARKKVTLNLPHSFAAHTLTASFDELEVLLEEPLVAEVWHRDLYRK